MKKLNCVLMSLLMVTRLVKFAAFGELFIHLPSEAAVVTVSDSGSLASVLLTRSTHPSGLPQMT
ncbi:MAG: hypothetical protein H6821_02730 [Planctomycetaceae bacterium]|nr:hypothetical protein [Planctomycetaceae bacterium]